MTHKHSLHIRLEKWRLSDLRERLVFANKLFTRVSFCSGLFCSFLTNCAIADVGQRPINLASQDLLLPHGATAKTLVPSGHVNS
jgi:hypothetical protein